MVVGSRERVGSERMPLPYFVRASSLVAVFFLTLSLGAQVARAQSGVTYDPGSPAGQEYALPLASARASATQTRAASAAVRQAGGSSAADAQLFGAGITRLRHRHQGATPSHPAGSGSESVASPAGEAVSVSYTATRLASGPTGLGASLLIGLIVVVGAAGAAFFVRRRSSAGAG